MTEKEILEAMAPRIKDAAKKIASSYCRDLKDEGRALTSYTREMLEDLECEGSLAVLELLHSGKYDPAVGELAAYTMPFVRGAMRRFLEKNLGFFSLTKERMTLVRKAKRLYGEGKSIAEISAALSVSEDTAAECVRYGTHFLSVYDLSEEDGDPYDWLEDTGVSSPEKIVGEKIRSEYLREIFLTLSEKEQDVIGKSFGVFGYEKTPVREIAMFHMVKESAVEKDRKSALKKMRKAYPGSKLELWNTVQKAIREAGNEIT